MKTLTTTLRSFLFILPCFLLAWLPLHADEFTIDGIIYATADGEAMVMGVEDQNITTAVIPAEVKGCPVTAIDSHAFFLCSLTSITLPDGLTEIGDYAFGYNPLQKTITIPASVTTIGYGAFVSCSNLEAITVAVGNTSFVVQNGVLFSADMTRLVAYPAAKPGTVYTVPGGVVSIDGVFEGCKAIKKVFIPNSVITIGEYTFYECTSLQEITISDNVTDIGNSTFWGCSSLQKITIPDSVTLIGSLAFAYCSSLQALVVGSGVDSIDNSAFNGCDNLSYVQTDNEYVREWFEEKYPDVVIEALSEELVGYEEVFNGNFLSPRTAGTPWFIQTDTFHSEPSALRSGAISHDEATALTATVSGTGILSFWYKTSSEKGYDILSFVVDGVQKLTASGGTDWTKYSITIATDGNHSLGWTYSKDSSVSTANDCVWLDDITWAPVTTAMLDGIIYVVENGKAKVAGVEDAGIAVAVIPAVVDGCSVTSMDDSAFYGCDQLYCVKTDNDFVKEWFADNMPDVLVIGMDEEQPAPPYDYTVDGIIYYIKNYEAMVAHVENKNITTAVIHAEVDGCPVTKIGVSAFEECTSLESVTIPDGVTIIDESAFWSCTKLPGVTLPKNLITIGHWAFNCCKSLTSITLPEGLTEIGDYAFGYTLLQKTITIPASVTTIGCGAFDSCSNLETITVAEGNTSFLAQDGVLFNADMTRLVAYPAVKPEAEYTVPAGVVSIDAAFVGCKAIKKVSIPNSVTMIGEYTFYECTSLQEITIPDSVTMIGEFTFYKCTSLQEITIPNRVTMIGESVFERCTSLQEITIPNSVTDIGSFAFLGCSSLQEITIPDSVAAIGYESFGNCSSLETLVVGMGVTWIDDDAFDDSDSLNCVQTDNEYVRGWFEKNFPGVLVIGMPHSTTTIDGIIYTIAGGEAAVTGVEDIDITVAVIPDEVEGCPVTSIDDAAFYGCDQLYCVQTDHDFVEEWFAVYMPGVLVIGMDEEPPAPPHDTTVDGIIYHIEKGEATVVGVEDIDITVAVIPEEVEECPVTAIDGWAFEGTALQTVVIPEGVTWIGGGAFDGCRSLSDVTLPGTLISIEYQAFHNCPSLQSITIPGSVTTIDSHAFSFCNLAGVMLPEGLEEIGYWAFFSCPLQKNLVVPANVTVIRNCAFGSCSSLEAIAVAEGNTSFQAQDGVLFSADMTRLVAYPVAKAGEVFAIPEGVDSIDGAFNGCTFLKKVTIPGSVASIGDYTFYKCNSIAEFTIPDNVTSIGYSAFEYCSALHALVVGSGVDSIDKSAFEGCNNLYYVQTDNEYVKEWFATNRPDVAIYGMDDELPALAFSLDDESAYVLGTIQTLRIDSLREGVTIYYRLDGETPTTADTLYSDALNLAETTTVSARAFVEGEPVGTTVTKTYTFLERVARPVISSGATAYFLPGSVVTANCATVDATLRYTTDGTTPTQESSVFPAGGLAITEDTVLKVQAFKAGMLPSYTVTSRIYIFQEFTDGDEVFNGDFLSLHSAGTPWFIQTDTFHSEPSALVSGSISDGEATALTAAVNGTGVISFWHKSSSEEEYDVLSFAVDGVQKLTASGETDWTKYSFAIATEGNHSLVWAYSKDSSYSIGSDCAWLDDITWTPVTTAVLNGIIYVIENGEATVAGVTDIDIDVAVIPSEVDDCPVTSIDDAAFYGCEQLYYVQTDNDFVKEWFADNMPDVLVIDLPYEITVDGIIYYIEDGAAMVIGVEDIDITVAVIPDEVDGCPVTSIDDAAFYGCDQLYCVQTDHDFVEEWFAVYMPGVLVIGMDEEPPAPPHDTTVDGIIYFIEKGEATVVGVEDIDITVAVIPEEVEDCPVTAIDDWAFERTALQTVVIPEGVTWIGGGAFDGCRSLSDVTLPGTLISIEFQAFHNCPSLESITIPGSVTTIDSHAFSFCSLAGVMLPEGLEEIGYWAFFSCPLQKNLVIPANVTVIRDCAFGSCSSLEAIAVAEGNTSFQAQDGVLFSADMTRLVAYPVAKAGEVFAIPEGVASIDGAFNGCTFLKKVTIPDSVASIGDYTFYKCKSLAEFTIPDNVTSIGYSAFAYCSALRALVVGSGVDSIDNSAFVGCNNLSYVQTDNEYVREWFEGRFPDVAIYGMDEEPVVLPYEITVDGIIYHIENGEATVTGVEDIYITAAVIPAVVDDCPVIAIGASAFKYCDSLESVAIPDGVTVIGDKSFFGCYELTDVTLPEGLTEIGDYAFKGSLLQETITIPATVTTIGCGVFGDCSNLEAITVAEGNTSFVAPDGVLFSADMTRLVAYPSARPEAEYIIPSGVVLIDEAFYDCRTIKKVSIPNSVTTIGDYTFDNCSSLQEITIPDSVTTIGNCAFECCDSLREITIPDSVTTIGNCAFEYCSSLRKITIPNSLISIGDYAFAWSPLQKTIMIPASVTTVGYAAFRSCDNLEAITVAEGNTSFQAQDGVLFSADMTRLIAYPAAKPEADYAVPYGVVSIDKCSFTGCNATKIVSIPNSVTTIGSSAFEDCASLQALIVGMGVASIDGVPFYGCKNLKYVQTDNEYVREWFEGRFPDVLVIGMDEEPPVLPYDTTIDGLIYHVENGEATVTGAEDRYITSAVILAEVDGYPVTAIGDSAFKYCSLESVTIPEGVKTIGDEAFYGCLFDSIAIPEGVTAIGSWAFEYCKNLAVIVLPGTLVTIGDGAFYGNGHLREFVVAEANVHFVSIDGVLYRADGEDGVPTTLLCYPPAKEGSEFIVPEGIEGLSNYAFYGCDNLVTITLSASVEVVTALGDYYGGLNYTYASGRFAAVNVQEGNTHFTSLDGVLFTADKSELLIYPKGKFTTEFTIPAEMVDGWTQLADVQALQAIYVAEDNEWFASQDGVLYTADMSELLVYPAGRRGTVLAIPDSVERINTKAFSQRYYSTLRGLVIGENMGVDGFDSIFQYRKLFYVQTDNEEVAAWFAEKRPDVVIVGMDEEAPMLPYETTLDGIRYYINTLQGEASVTGVTSMKIREAFIPDEINGYPVTGIDYGAFEYCFYLERVHLPNGLCYIGEEAFYCCYSLTSITLPKGLCYIEEDAFYCCYSLTSITLPEGLEQIYDYAFDRCSGLVSVTILASVEIDWSNVFWRCNNLRSIDIAEENEYYTSRDGVVYDKDCTAMVFCPMGKETLTLPATVECIYWGDFDPGYWDEEEEGLSNCTTLKSIKVEEGSEAFASKDGVLYTKDMSHLLIYPQGKMDESFTVPATVTGISTDSLSLAPLKEILVADGNTHFTSQEGVLYTADMDALVCYPRRRPDAVFTVPPTVSSLDISCSEYLVGVVFGNAEMGFDDVTLIDRRLTVVQTDNEEMLKYSSRNGVTFIGMDEALPEVRFVTQNGLLFRIMDGEAGVMGVEDWDMTDVVIPTQVEGCPVTAIRDFRSEMNDQLPIVHSITLPSTSIFDYLKMDVYRPSFGAYKWFEHFEVGEGHPEYSSKEGVLFSADGTVLLEYPSARDASTYTVPNGCKIIEEDAFDETLYLEAIVIPDSVETIDGWAFDGCFALREVVIGDGVTYIGNYAFDSINSLKTVYTDNDYVKGWFTAYCPDVEILPRAAANTPSVPCKLKAGWNLVGIPFELDEASRQVLEAYRPFTFDTATQGYILAHDFVPGSTVWIFANQAAPLTLYGTISATTGVNLQKGWNVVSPIYREDGSAVSIEGLGEVWSWISNMYAPAENATYGTGYWIYSDQPQTIWK